MRPWIRGAAVVLCVAAVYLVLRPPLYHFDGVVYRLKAFGPFEPSVNPHHLLWHPLQVGLLKAATMAGNSGTLPFQLFGVSVNCLTLLLFHVVLQQMGAPPLFSTSATLLVAFSPTFWHFGFQNLPYPLTYLFALLFIVVWARRDGRLPDTRRLVVAGAAASAAIFLQQAFVLFVAAGALTLLLCGTGSLLRRMMRSIFWGGSIAAVVLAIYVAMAAYVGIEIPGGFFRWITLYTQTEHPVRIHLLPFFAKSVIGTSRSVVRTSPLESILQDRFAPDVILAGYALVGLAALIAVVVLWRKWVPTPLAELLRGNALFALCAFSILAWSAFVFAWEPTGHFWNLNLFPALVCFPIVLANAPARRWRAVSAVFLAVSCWNVYANHAHDQEARINDPEPLIASLRAHLSDQDIFIVLGRDWFADMDYDLLFECLNRSGWNPGKALLNDYVMEPDGARWAQNLSNDINEVLGRGGKVYISDHLLWPESYRDLMQAQDAFSEFVHEQYKDIDGPELGREVERFFEAYRLVETDLKIGKDEFWEVCRP